jgi:hypothetical protein
LDPIMIYRLGQIRQQEILEQARPSRGEYQLNPVLLAAGEWFRSLLKAVNRLGRQERRGLAAKEQAYKVIEECYESDQREYADEPTAAGC